MITSAKTPLPNKFTFTDTGGSVFYIPFLGTQSNLPQMLTIIRELNIRTTLRTLTDIADFFFFLRILSVGSNVEQIEFHALPVGGKVVQLFWKTASFLKS